MSARRILLVGVAGAALLAGCTPTDPVPSVSGTPTPTSTVTTGADPIRAALCASGAIDPARFADATARARTAYPGVSDERALLALSLVPAALVSGAGLTVGTHPAASANAAYVQDGQLSVPAGSTIAPAEIAYTIMESVAHQVLTDSLVANPEMGVDAELMGFVVLTIALDGYIKIAQTQPAMLQGEHLTEVRPLVDAPKRILLEEPQFAQGSITKLIFAAEPAYWPALAAFIGTEFYREDPDQPALYALRSPVAEGEASTALAGRLRTTC